MERCPQDGTMSFKQGTPTDNDLLCLAQDSVSIWMKLGLALGLSQSQLDEIDADQSKVIDKSYKMLRKWKESLGVTATFERLAEGLDHKVIKRHDLIDEYCLDKASKLAQRMTDLAVSTVSAGDDNSRDKTAAKFLPSVSILPGKPFHVTQRRGREIQKIREAFSQLRQNASNSLVAGVFVKGPPGCGKTQLARQFGEEYMNKTDDCGMEFPRRKIVATLNSRSIESLLESYRELHEKMKIPKHFKEIGSARERVQAFADSLKRYLKESCSSWLIIVDNLTVNDPFREFWPTPEENSPWGEGLVLVTTQDSELAPRAHAQARVLGLDSGMEEVDAMDLLSAVSGIAGDLDAKRVAQMLGYYPLSLACAAVYVRQMREDRPVSKFSWKNYMANLQEYFAYLDHSDYTHHNTCYPQSMLPAAEFAARRMAENNEVLRAAFVFLSYCALQPVPLDSIAQYILNQTADTDNGKIRVPDDIKLKIARCSLLIYPETGERGIEVVTLHQVMRLAFLQIRRKQGQKTGTPHKSAENTLKSEERREQNGVLQTLTQAYKDKKDSTKKDAIATRIILSPHMKEFVDRVENCQLVESSLLVQTLVYLADSLVHVAGATDNSRVALLERAYNINKQFGQDDLSACDLLCDLGYTYREAGKLDEVIPVLEEADILCQEHTEPEWMKKRSNLLNTLAFTFREKFQLDLAKEYMKMCVEVTKIAFGKNDVQVVERLCNLGVILHDRWENDEAIEVLEEARSIVETCDVSELFIRAQVLNYTAKVHLRWYLGLRFTHPRAMNTRKHLEESDHLHAEALKIYMDLHGDQQKFTTGVMMTYGTAKLHLGDLAQAQEMCEKAVEVYRGAGHIAWPRAGTFLADIFLARQEYLRAKEFLEELEQVHKDLNLVVSPGAYHPRALLAEAYGHLGNVESALEILEQLLEEWRKNRMHPEHYWVARARAFVEELKSHEEEVVEYEQVPSL